MKSPTSITKYMSSAYVALAQWAKNTFNLKALAIGAVVILSAMPAFSSDIEVVNMGSNVVSNIREILYDKGLPVCGLALGIDFLSMFGASKVDDIVARLKVAGGIILAGVGIFIFCRDDKTVVNTVSQLVNN